MKIKRKDDFELGAMSIIRNFLASSDVKYINLYKKCIVSFINTWSDKTFHLTIRDSMEMNVFSPVPDVLQKEWDSLCRNVIWYANTIKSNDLETIYSWTGESIYHRFDTYSDFETWYKAEDASFDFSTDATCDTDSITLPDTDENTALCIDIINSLFDYSYGRQSYMPLIAVDVIKANFNIFSTQALFEIENKLALLEDKRINSPDYDWYDKTWENLLIDIRYELIKRNPDNISNFVSDYDNIDSLNKHRDCLLVLQRLRVIGKEHSPEYEKIFKKYNELFMEEWNSYYTEVAPNQYRRKQ